MPSSVESMDIEEASRPRTHQLTLLKISGALAGVAALVLVIILPVYFEVIEPNNAKDDGKIDQTSTTKGGVFTVLPTTTPVQPTTKPELQQSTTKGQMGSTIQPITTKPEIQESTTNGQMGSTVQPITTKPELQQSTTNGQTGSTVQPITTKPEIQESTTNGQMGSTVQPITTKPEIQESTTGRQMDSTVQPTTMPLPELPEMERFDCLPSEVASEDACIERGCKWTETTTDAPSCYHSGPRSYSIDGTTNIDTATISTTLKLRSENASNYYGKQFEMIKVETIYVTENTLRIKIYPDGVERYEVPIDHLTPSSVGDLTSAVYNVEHSSDDENFGVKVVRKSTSKVLFDTTVGDLMFADQFLQISTKVASEYVYGFGEHQHRSFKHDMNWKTYGMFTYDQNVKFDYNLYGVQTYFMCMEGDGNAYGVFFVNSNAMEVALQPTPAITYRTIGGILDFYIFVGPSPEEVTQQYMGVIGNPYFPPYWSLGFQLCRWNYGSLEKLQLVVNRTLESGIPYDVQYSDIDYMERQLDFTINDETYNGITEFVLDLKKTYHMKYIIIIDPAISGNETESYPPFEDGLKDDIFIKYQNGEIAWGKVWPDKPNITVDDSKDKDYQVENYRAHTAYPDFFNPNTTAWWKKLITDFRNTIEFDALWIDMNEPTSFTNGTAENYCPDSKFDNPPFYPNLVADHLYDLTICMQALQYNPKTRKYTEHYNLHSLYGYSEVEPTLEACRESTGKRCMVLTRSTYPGAGKNSGHWLGDNASTWEYLRASIVGMMEFSLFGFAYNGADVCGFFQNTTYELCLRWMQVGAFYPYYRNHNIQKTIDQDPAVFGQDFIDNITTAMHTRYELLPYLYTLLYDATTTGSTVVRSLMHQFPTDNKTYEIDSQFLWGAGLLITPVMHEGERSVEGYFPKGRWFDYYSGAELPDIGDGKNIDLPTALNEINVHVHGGNVIPTQESANNTYYSRQNPLGLIVALNENLTAQGKLFWDDGDSIDSIVDNNYLTVTFDCAESRLSITTEKMPSGDLNITSLYFDNISIYGVKEIVTIVQVTTGSGASVDITSFENVDGTLLLKNLGLKTEEDHYLTWG